MALSILDGNQSATTLSTILSSGQHITAHTVVSLGTQAITDMRGAVSGSVVSISNLPATQPISIASVTIGNTVTIAGTVTANPTGTQTIAGTVTASVVGRDANSTATPQIPVIAFDEGISAANVGYVVPVQVTNVGGQISEVNPLPISGTVTIGSALPAGTNRIGVVTIGAGTVTIGAGTAQIGSVTASISGTVPISISSVTVGVLPDLTTSTDFEQAGTQIAVGITNYGSIPVAILAGTAQIGSVTASISNSLTIGSLPAISGTVTANTFAVQGTAVTTSNFTSTTASTVLASFNATREVLTIFNEGAGNLHICAGATCTTIAYQVRLSAGDYYEVPNHQTTITHSAVFATAGTARICQVS